MCFYPVLFFEFFSNRVFSVFFLFCFFCVFCPKEFLVFFVLPRFFGFFSHFFGGSFLIRGSD